MEVADKKKFGEKGILKAEIFLFMILSKLRPQRGKHLSVDRGYQQYLGLQGPVMALSMAFALKVLPLRGRDKCTHDDVSWRDAVPGGGRKRKKSSISGCCHLVLVPALCFFP